MSEEEKMPTYGKLYAENFRLEHNNRVLQERETQLKSVLEEIREIIKEGLDFDNPQYADECENKLLEIINKVIGEDK